jgi:hypothetical protein
MDFSIGLLEQFEMEPEGFEPLRLIIITPPASRKAPGFEIQ